MSETDPAKPDFRALFEAIPTPCLVLLPDVPRYTIVAATDAYVRATNVSRDELLGRGLFELFAGDRTDPAASAVNDLGASLGRVLTEHAADTVVIQLRD